MANATNTSNPITVAQGGSGVASTTAYGVICGGTSSTGALQNAGAGTSGQILRSGGAAALPSYSTATYPATAGTSGNILASDGTNFVSSTNSSVGASLVLISNQTASASATIDFTNISVTTYRKYLLFFRAIIPATDGSSLRMQGSNDNGATWIVTTYQSGCNSNDYNTATIVNTNSTTDFALTPALDNGSATSLANGKIEIYTNGANHTYIVGTFSCFNNTSGVASFGQMGGRVGTNGVNAFRMIMSAGNITSGVFQLFGVLGA